MKNFLNKFPLWAACKAAFLSLILSCCTVNAATIVFQDGFETQTVGVSPVTAPIGTYVAAVQPAPVTNAVPPGAQSGTNYTVFRRSADPGDNLRGLFSQSIPLGGNVHFECWVWIDGASGQVRIGLSTGVTADANIARVRFVPSTGQILVNDGTAAYFDSGLTFTPGQWVKYEIDYTVGAAELTLKANGVAAATPMVTPVATSVTGIWFSTDAADTLFYVDDVLVKATAPTAALVFLDGYEQDAPGNFGKIIGLPPLGNYVGGVSKPDVYRGSNSVYGVPGPAPVSGTTNYIIGQRNATRNDNLHGKFTPAATNTVHFEVWQLAQEPGPGSISSQFIIDTPDRSLGAASSDAFTFSLWTGPDHDVKIYNNAGGSTGHHNTGLQYKPGVWQKYEIDYTPGNTDGTFTLDGVSTNFIVGVGAYTSYPTIDGCWLYQADNNSTNAWDECKVQVRTAGATNTVFYDGYETYPLGPKPFPPTIGSYLPVGDSGLVTNDVAPGAFTGANFLRLVRGAGGVPHQVISAQFSPTANYPDDVTHFECWINNLGPLAQFSLNHTPNGLPDDTDVSLWSDGRVSIYSGSAHIFFPGLTYMTNEWTKFALDYTNGASNVRLTLNDTNTVLGAIAPPLSRVNGFWLYSGDTGTQMDVDDVSATLIAKPQLNISRNGNQATLNWFAPAGYVLQENTNLLNPAGWTNVPGGGDSPVTVPIGGVPKYFRLKK